MAQDRMTIERGSKGVKLPVIKMIDKEGQESKRVMGSSTVFCRCGWYHIGKGSM